MIPTDPNHGPQAPTKPWQFSLKSLVFTLTGCSVLFGLIAAGALPIVLALFYVAVVATVLLMLLVYLFNHPRVAAVCIGGVTLLVLAPMLMSRARQSRRTVITLPQISTSAPETSDFNVCSDNLHRIAAALNAYHDEHGRLPPPYTVDAEGGRLHSWRTLILPHLGHDDLYRQIRLDEPWDSRFNRRFHQIEVNVFACPADPGHPCRTNYVVVTGPGTAWPGSEALSLDRIDDESNTILVVEKAGSRIHWMEPRDLHVVQMAKGINPKNGQGISSYHLEGANVAFLDGHHGYLPDAIDPNQIDAMLTIDGGEKVDAND